ncbi:MAG: hypothetical protein E7010_05870 [Alphaproteobacteria bacterium]|nr:hypothetical protein [Alphaproteobacteria bacterium]
MSYNDNTRQLAIEFPHRPSLDKEDFFVAPCNIEAVEMIDRWPNWPHFAICIYGSEGCGKSHLANVFASNVSAHDNYPYRIPCVQAKDIKLDSPHKLFAQHRCLIVENLCRKINYEAMFHLYNLYRNEGGFILFTSQIAPARMNISLPDLQSRLNIMPSLEIKDPDDELLSCLLVKLFSDRQIFITPEQINFIVSNMQRSFAYARKLVKETDRISLSLKRAVSIPIIKEAMTIIDSEKLQGDLFE